MFTIYIDRLKSGEELYIEERASSELLGIENDPEIQPRSEIVFTGKAYLVEEYMIIEGRISTSCTMACSMCNELFELPIVIEEWRYEESIEKFRAAIFSYAGPIREAILIEVPYLGRCGGKSCRNAEEMAIYLKKAEHKKEPELSKKQTKDDLFLQEYEKEQQENGYQPFKDLL